MKKIILTLLMISLISSCGKENENKNTPTPPKNKIEQANILQQMKHKNNIIIEKNEIENIDDNALNANPNMDGPTDPSIDDEENKINTMEGQLPIENNNGDLPIIPGDTTGDSPDVPGGSTGDMPSAPGDTAGDSPDVPGDTTGDSPDVPGGSAGDMPSAPGGSAGDMPSAPGGSAGDMPSAPSGSAGDMPPMP